MLEPSLYVCMMQCVLARICLYTSEGINIIAEHCKHLGFLMSKIDFVACGEDDSLILENHSTVVT